MNSSRGFVDLSRQGDDIRRLVYRAQTMSPNFVQGMRSLIDKMWDLTLILL